MYTSSSCGGVTEYTTADSAYSSQSQHQAPHFCTLKVLFKWKTRDTATISSHNKEIRPIGEPCSGQNLFLLLGLFSYDCLKILPQSTAYGCLKIRPQIGFLYILVYKYGPTGQLIIVQKYGPTGQLIIVKKYGPTGQLIIV